LIKKLGPNAFPFTFQLPTSAPGSVTLQPGAEDQGQPCGVNYYVKVFSGENESDRSHKRSTVSLGIRKIQYAPSKMGRQPCTLVRKDFMLSPGELELEVTLDKQVQPYFSLNYFMATFCEILKLKLINLIPRKMPKVLIYLLNNNFQLYHHDETISVNICVRNHSNKTVKKIKAMVQQGVDISVFQNGQLRSCIAQIETS